MTSMKLFLAAGILALCSFGVLSFAVKAEKRPNILVPISSKSPQSFVGFYYLSHFEKDSRSSFLNAGGSTMGSAKY